MNTFIRILFLTVFYSYPVLGLWASLFEEKCGYRTFSSHMSEDSTKAGFWQHNDNRINCLHAFPHIHAHAPFEQESRIRPVHIVRMANDGETSAGYQHGWKSPRHRKTKARNLNDRERRVSSPAVDETVELPGSGVDMTPEMVLEAGKLPRAEQNLIEQC